MRKSCYVLVFLMLVLFSFSFAGVTIEWTQQTVPLEFQSANLNEIIFPEDDLIGFAGVGGTGFSGVIKTTDGGENWVSLDVPSAGRSLRDLKFLNNNFGIGVGNEGLIIYTKDGGTTWEVDTTSIPEHTNKAWVIDENTAYIINNTQQLYKTTDGCATWELVHSGGIKLIDDVDADNFYGIESNAIKKSSDGCVSWEDISPASVGKYFGIDAIDANTMCAVAKSGIVHHTNDGGATWETQDPKSSAKLTDVFYRDGSLGLILAGSGGGVRITSNTGVVWDTLYTGVSDDISFKGVSYLSNNGIIMCGSFGTILKGTIPGGETAIDKESPKTPEFFLLEQNYPNPFNPTTQITYSVVDPGQYTLEIYNVLGQKIKTIVSEYKVAGTYSATWDASNNLGLPVNSGIYFYTLKSKGVSVTKKMLFQK